MLMRKLGFALVYVALALFAILYIATFTGHEMSGGLWHLATILGICGLVAVLLYFLGRMFGVAKPYTQN